MKHKLHLLVPGLFGPMPSATDVAPEKRWPALERQLFRAKSENSVGNDYETTLLSLFGISGLGALPTAPLRRLGDGAEADKHYWLQLNPVFLRPDQDRLLVFASDDFDLTISEAEALAAAFTDHFAQQGWVLEVPCIHRWYLRLPEDPQLQLAEFQQVLGRNMDPFLPEGNGAKRWRTILNEVQMLFYNHPVNTKREAAGLAPINGVWFSGGGSLLQQPEAPIGWLASSETLAKGMAKSINLTPIESDDVGTYPIREAEGVVIYDRCLKPVCNADPYSWMEAVSHFEQWLGQLQQHSPKERVSINLYPCDGKKLQLRSGINWQPWRKPRSLLEQLAENKFLL